MAKELLHVWNMVYESIYRYKYSYWFYLQERTFLHSCKSSLYGLLFGENQNRSLGIIHCKPLIYLPKIWSGHFEVELDKVESVYRNCWFAICHCVEWTKIWMGRLWRFLQYETALANQCDCLLTRNTADFATSSIPVYNAVEFIALIDNKITDSNFW